MLNDQLLAYIRGEAARGLHRAAISKVLVGAGWPAQDVHEALVALAVPLDEAVQTPIASAQPPPATTTGIPVVPVPVAMPPAATTVPVAPKPIAPIGMPAMVPNMYGTGSGKVPGVFALIKNGLAIYQARFATLIALGLLQVALAAVCLGLVAWVSQSSMLPLHSLNSISPVVVVVAVIAFLLVLVCLWLGVWFALASLHAIRGSEEKLSFGKSLQRARTQVWGLIGISVLRIAAVFGALALYVLMPALVIGEASTLAEPYLHQYTALAILAVGLGALFGLCVVSILYSTRLMFAAWVYVNGEGAGINALVRSILLTKGRLGTVLWRATGIFLIVFIIEGLMRAILSSIFGTTAPGALHTVRGTLGLFLNSVLAILAVGPILSGTLYTLYASVRNIAGIPEVPPESKKTIRMLSALGAVALVAVPVVATVLAVMHAVNLVEFLQGTKLLLKQ